MRQAGLFELTDHLKQLSTHGDPQEVLGRVGFDLGAPTPDANTIRLFREKLTEVGALDMVFADFDRQLKERGYLAMGGQIVDATLVAAPKQRNTTPEKEAIKAGKTASEIWPD
jgi:hypothetical protein